MLNRHNKYFAFFLFASIFLFGTGESRSLGSEVLTFGPHEAKIMGYIPYTVIGTYEVKFRSFKGKVTVDEKLQSIQSVYLEIEANSIESNCPWCDKVARSRKFLNTARYPKIIFKSDRITHDQGGFNVKGVLRMQQIKRRLSFPFNARFIFDRENNRKILELKGAWRINRKEFNIIWNKYLDRGGVLVGDIITVDWAIRVEGIVRKSTLLNPQK